MGGRKIVCICPLSMTHFCLSMHGLTTLYTHEYTKHALVLPTTLAPKGTLQNNTCTIDSSICFAVYFCHFLSLVSPSTNIQKNVDRWKNLTNTRRPHQKLLVSPSFSVAWKETGKGYFSGSSSTTSSLTRWKAVWQRAELRFLEMHSSVHPIWAWPQRRPRPENTHCPLHSGGREKNPVSPFS